MAMADSAHAEEVQLRSFASCADLKRPLRARAARCTSTRARLRMAEAALRERREHLLTSLALERAVASLRGRPECE